MGYYSSIKRLTGVFKTFFSAILQCSTIVSDSMKTNKGLNVYCNNVVSV